MVQHLQRIYTQLIGIYCHGEACAALGLLENANEWDLCLQEACPVNSGHSLCGLSTAILLECSPEYSRQLWDLYQRWLWDDCRHILTNKYFRDVPEDENKCIAEEESLALYLINVRLEQGSQPPNIMTLRTFGLPWPHINFDDILPGGNCLLYEE